MTTIVPTCRWLNINKNSFTDVAFNIGQCITDSMSISSPGAHGSPAICATNSGYHSKYDSIPMFWWFSSVLQDILVKYD